MFSRAPKDAPRPSVAASEPSAPDSALIAPGEPVFARPAAPMPAVRAAATGDIDVRAIGDALWRKRVWIILPTMIAALVSFVAVNSITPRYRSEARILIDGRDNVFLRPNAESRDAGGALDPEAVTSQVQLVLSRNLARDVIAKNGLASLPEFDPVLRGFSPLRTVLSLFGLGRDPLGTSAEQRVMDAYFERLTAYAVDKSRVIAIEFQSTDRELAARVANSIAEGYLELQQAARLEQARVAGQWLSGEIDSLRKKVAEAESRVEEFRSKTNLFVGLNNTNLSAQQLGEVSTQLNAARAQQAEADNKARLIRGMLQSGRPIEASDVLNSELVRRLNEQRVTLSAQLAEQSSTLLGGHPRIKELRAQIADLDRQIRDEAAKFARALENDAKIAGGRVETLSASLDQFKRQASSTNTQDVELRALEREAKSQRDLLESYLAKYREATTRETIDSVPAEARIISRAGVANTPAYPKKLPIVVIATLAMFLLSSGLIVTGELLRMTAPVAADAASRPVPREPAFAPAGPVAAAPPPAAAPAAPPPAAVGLEDLAHALCEGGEGSKRIAVMGASPRSGATLTALTLARAMSRQRRVVVADLSFASPAIAMAASEQGAPGLAELVSGEASFGDIITRDRMSGVHLVGAGRGEVDPAVLQSPHIGMALDALTRVYDHVVMDVGALTGTPNFVFGLGAHAVVVADPALPEPAREMLQAQLMKVGFSGVTILSAPDGDTIGPDTRMAAA